MVNMMRVVLSAEVLSVHRHKHVKIYLQQIVNVAIQIATVNMMHVAPLVMVQPVVQMLVVEIYQSLQINVSIQIMMENMMHVAFSEQDHSVPLHSHVLGYQLYEIQQ
jgi:hypothetical protein